MSPLTTVRLAVAGERSDTVRIALTAVGAMLGTVTMLAAATVLSIVTPRGLLVSPEGKPTFNDGSGTWVESDHVLPYTNALLNEDGLRPGVALSLVLLTIPLLAFVGQCSRLGAPARDRRLAAIRMAGATGRQVMWVAAVESGLASIVGVGAGLGAYLLGRRLLDDPAPNGTRPLPTDVLPAASWMIGIGIAVPLLVTLLSVLALRRVAVTPLGVVRNVRTGRPSAMPGVLIGLGIGAFATIEPINQFLQRRDAPDDLAFVVVGGVMFVGVLLVSIGVVAGTGWLTHMSGRLLHRYARRPAALLAGRRMIADPWSGSRTFAAMLVALVIGAFAAGAHAMTATESLVNDVAGQRWAELQGDPYRPADTSFYDRAYQLIGYAVVVGVVIAAAGLLVALADGIVARRRTLTSLVAAGTPRATLAAATAWQVFTPVVPAVLLAVSAGIALPRRVFREASSGTVSGCQPLPGDPVDACQDAAYAAAHTVTSPVVTLPVPVPWEQLALLVGGALTATVVITAVGLLFLRMSTAVTELRTT